MDKKSERSFLNSFAQQYLEFPKGSIHAYEKPDFVVNGRHQKIGIEITRVFRDHEDGPLSMQAQEDAHVRTLKLAQRYFEEKHGKQYNVFVSFQEKSKILKNEIDVLAKFIVEKMEFALEKNPLHDDDDIMLSGSEIWPNQHQIFTIQIYRFKTDPDFKWEGSNLHQVEPVNETSIRNAIIKKEKTGSGYRTCDEVWLILAVEFWNPMLDAAIPKNFGFKVDDSRFNRIILFKTAENIIHEIFNRK